MFHDDLFSMEVASYRCQGLAVKTQELVDLGKFFRDRTVSYLKSCILCIL